LLNHHIYEKEARAYACFDVNTNQKFLALFFLRSRIIELEECIVQFFKSLMDLDQENIAKVHKIFREDGPKDKVKTIIVIDWHDGNIT
jgi:hypothetical protein